MASGNLFDLMGQNTYRPLRPTTKAKPVLKNKVEQVVQTVPPPLFALDLLWQDALALVKPFTTQLMLRQQCRLLAFDGWAARIGTTSPPLFKMASDRLPNIEAAFAQLCDHPIRASLEIVPVDASVSAVPTCEAIAPSLPETDLPRSIDWEGSMSQSRRDYGFFQ